uniref:Zn(2)-C6 fungal-type domain-containing protein n=1 Tax=Bionectria ochroleuca TaxID=29856 RepID=A0A8H7TNQ6_BIOOC
MTSVVGSPSSSNASSKTSARPSGRKGSRKVRTGCLTCKIRKVKCDENKPNCLRCTKTGRKCDGYVAPLPRAQSTKLPNLAPELMSSEDYHAFDYYRVRSSAVLGGIVRDSGDDFWSGLVIRLAITEPAVRHALLALSSVHEKVIAIGDKPETRIPNTTFAFGDSEPATIPLLVCVLFICIEFLMDYEAAAQVHISQGRKILSQISEAQAMASSPAAEMLRNVLVPIYTRLSLASFLFGHHPASIPDFFLGDWSVPFSFASLHEARDALFGLLNCGLQFSMEIMPLIYDPTISQEQLQGIVSRQRAILARLAEWRNAFAVLEATLSPKTALQDLLHMYYHTAHIWVSGTLGPNELVFDEHLAGFGAIVSHAASGIAAAPSLRGKDAASFVFETEFVPPLYYVAMKCRHPMLRRAAIRLLGRREVVSRRENFWRAREYLGVAVKAMEMEEAHIASSPRVADLWDAADWDLKVPVWEPPTFRVREVPSMANLSINEDGPRVPPLGRLESPDGSESSGSSVLTAGMEMMEELSSLDPGRLVAPFRIPAERRLRNVLIMQKTNGGARVTVFKDPGLGETEWKVKKFFWEF